MAKQLSDALMELKLQDAERTGVEEPPPPKASSEKPPPEPEPFVMEKPDWRAEELERARRDHATASTQATGARPRSETRSCCGSLPRPESGSERPMLTKMLTRR